MTAWLTAGNNAVITGGASGIGLAAATRFTALGMNVLIADSNLEALTQAATQLQGAAGKIFTQTCDVSDIDQVLSLQATAAEQLGAVHCLMKNAGVGLPPSLPWETLDNWHRQLDVNLWGIINGCQAFIPSMLATEQPGAIINTGSKQGITNPPGNYAYNLSKAAVKAYTESVAHALRDAANNKLTAHLLIPGFTYTGMIARYIKEQPPGAWTPEQVVDFMLAALAEDSFYILCPDNDTPHELDAKRIQWNTDDLLHNRPALSRWSADHQADYDDFVNR